MNCQPYRFMMIDDGVAFVLPLTVGGAIDVPGNVSANDTREEVDETAEWNFFWDPRAAKRVRPYHPSIPCPE